MAEKSAHHILNDRLTWNSRPESRALRAYPPLIPRIYQESHNNLHANTPAVPLLGYHALQSVHRGFQCGPDTMRSIDYLLFAIEDAADHPKAHRIEKQLCHLAISAIELQRPFIQDGLTWRNKK